MRADGWSRMPLVRMTNLHLEPGRGLARGADRRTSTTASTSRRTRAGRSTTSASTSSSGRRSRGRSRTGKLGRMLRDATYTGVTPRLLGHARRGRGAGRVAAVRADELRQGPARPVARTSRTAPRRRASATSQVGVAGLSRALELAEQALAARAEGDEAEVLVHAERSGVARFAGSVRPPADAVDDAIVRLRVVRDGTRRRGASTNRVDARACAELARRAGEAADSARPDPDFPGLAPPAEYPSVDGYDEETAALGPDDQARLAAACDRGRRRLRALRLLHERRHRDRARVARPGSARTQALTDATRARARGDRRRLGLGGAHELARRATSTRRRSRARRREQGGADARRRGDRARARTPRCSSRTPSPSCCSWFSYDSLGALGFSRSAATSAAASASASSTRRSRSPTTASTRWTARRLRLRGHAQAARDDDRERRRARRRLGPDDRGARRRRPRVDRPRPPEAGASTGRCRSALDLAAGDAASVDELAERIGDGIYVTRLHYLGIIDPRGGVLTGMTRDGTFRIRDGKVAEPLVNLRFTVADARRARRRSRPDARAHARQPERLYDERYPFGALVPALATASSDHGHRLRPGLSRATQGCSRADAGRPVRGRLGGRRRGSP